MIMNSNMVKPETFDHLHLVYHFTVPLNTFWACLRGDYKIGCTMGCFHLVSSKNADYRA